MTYICPCEYPKMILEKTRGITYFAMPLELLFEEGMLIPDMEIVEDINFDGKKGKYMRVEWLKPHELAKRHEVNEHIVITGCPLGEDGTVEICDAKSIFAVYHPIDEWNKYHMIDMEIR